jgi:hypothetical protein
MLTKLKSDKKSLKLHWNSVTIISVIRLVYRKRDGGDNEKNLSDEKQASFPTMNSLLLQVQYRWSVI